MFIVRFAFSSEYIMIYTEEYILNISSIHFAFVRKMIPRSPEKSCVLSQTSEFFANSKRHTLNGQKCLFVVDAIMLQWVKMKRLTSSLLQVNPRLILRGNEKNIRKTNAAAFHTTNAIIHHVLR